MVGYLHRRCALPHEESGPHRDERAHGRTAKVLLGGIRDTVADSSALLCASALVAGRAEIRAYYTGTALAIGSVLLSAEVRTALRTVAFVLGGFAGSRMLSYTIDGVDSDPSYRLHQHGVFVGECLGTLTAAALLAMQPTAKSDAAKR